MSAFAASAPLPSIGQRRSIANVCVAWNADARTPALSASSKIAFCSRVCAAARGVWNTYTVEWSPSRVEIWVNGATCLVNTSGDPAFGRQYIIALTAALGGAGNGYDGAAPLPATLNVDPDDVRAPRRPDGAALPGTTGA